MAVDRSTNPDNVGYKDKETLNHLYHDKNLSIRKIGSMFDVSGATIRYWLEKYDIPTRTIKAARSTNVAKFNLDSHGYEYWSTSVDRESISVRVHRLLAVAEGADPHEIFSGDLVVHHKNGLSWDNRPENIEPLSPSDHWQEHESMGSYEEFYRKNQYTQ